jgi:hypothetical protein
MIEAVLRGKVSDQVMDDEDLLTSTVWGLLKYRSLRPILTAFLSKATLYGNDGIKFGGQISGKLLDTDHLKFEFWPRDPDFGEPDLLIEVGDLALLVEVKFHAQLSGEDQLQRYWRLLNKRCSAKPRKHIIFLTADWIVPLLSENATAGLEGHLWWLSWYDLAEAIRESSNATASIGEVESDLVRYMKRLGFEFFHGISSPPVEPLETIFWSDVIPLISNYQPMPKVQAYFWQQKEKV